MLSDSIDNTERRSRRNPDFGLAEFDEPVARLDSFHNGFKRGCKPAEKIFGRGISNAQPNNDRAARLPPKSIHKILILGEDDRLVLERVGPNFRIGGVSQACFFEVFGFVSVVLEDTG